MREEEERKEEFGGTVEEVEGGARRVEDARCPCRSAWWCFCARRVGVCDGRCAFGGAVRSYREDGLRAEGAIEPCDTAGEADHCRERSSGGIKSASVLWNAFYFGA